MTTPQLERIVLASRPKGAPTPNDFRQEFLPVPTPGDGEVLLRTHWLSLDPYMRGRMSDAPSYAPPVAIGEVIVGGAVSVVEKSSHPGFAVGELVLGSTGWQSYSVSNGKGLSKLPPGMKRPSQAVGVLGMPGFTAYMGLFDIGAPKAGETVVVAAATGAVGAVVGQLAKHHGCRVVGIAGGADKCRYAVETLKFDACLDHKAPELKKRLKEACPQGIDVYFENVGGAVFEAVLPLLNTKARVPMCGVVSHYNDEALPAGPDRTGLLLASLVKKRIRMQGFIIFEDYGSRYGEFLTRMGPLVAEGKVVMKEDVVVGLDQAIPAFIGLLEGRNFGKLVVQVSKDAP
jgi:NADPH-dependent curcumin reductase CurA